MCVFTSHVTPPPQPHYSPLLFFRQPRSKLDPRTIHEKEAMPVYEISDFRAGEGIPLQHVSDQRPTLRGVPHTQFNRETSEDLVPEQKDENEEAEQGEEWQGAPMKPPAAARYPTSRDSCANVLTHVCVHARTFVSMCVCVRASSSCIPLGWSQCFGGDPAA